MPKKKLSLEDIFEDDDLGILDDKAEKSNEKTSDERLVESFEEINSFVDKNEREPEKGKGISEMRLQLRLKGFRENEKKKAILKNKDRHNLLFKEEEKIESVDDILKTDELGLLDEDEEGQNIFYFKHAPKEKRETDFVSQRKPLSAEDFSKYEKKFKTIHQQIKLGKRQLKNFNKAERNLQEGNYYILDGMMLFLEFSNIESSERKLGDRVRKDGRTKIIFDNGTYSNMLFRSLAKQLYENGKIVTELDQESEQELFSNSSELSEKDKETGWIYVLKSKSNNSKIKEIKNLFKIGFSTTPVEKRILNSRKEATFLNAEVEIVATFRCMNTNTQKFENLIHQFFSAAKLEIDIYDKKKNRVTPREWFKVPYPIIERVIGLFNSGKITKYYYDFQQEKICKRTK